LKEKRVVFKECETRHASLLSKLRTYKISQNIFFQFVVEMFITDDPCIVAFEEKLLDSHSSLGQNPRQTLRDLASRGKANFDMLNISNEEREELFDLLEADLNGDDL